MTDEQQERFDFTCHRDRGMEAYRRVFPLCEGFAQVLRDVIRSALADRRLLVHSVEARAKSPESFGKKAATPLESDPGRPKYVNPLTDITDQAAARVITFFPRALSPVCDMISDQFEVIEKRDKGADLLREARFGYQSIHFLVRLKRTRTELPEYARFAGLRGEIQVRTILQHAWAEIEHDIQYKSVATIPQDTSRRFMALAGMLEMADKEFQAIQDDDLRFRQEARQSVEQGRLGSAPITPEALKAYVDERLGPDGRMSEYSYDWGARLLKALGFADFAQVDRCLEGLDDDEVSRLVMGYRQGQLGRFESLLLAGMGDLFLQRHPMRKEGWYAEMLRERLAKLHQSRLAGLHYDPLEPIGDASGTST